MSDRQDLEVDIGVRQGVERVALMVPIHRSSPSAVRGAKGVYWLTAAVKPWTHRSRRSTPLRPSV